MPHLLLTVLVLAAGPSGSGAGEATVRLYVRPMPAPRPALKYQLLPDLSELQPGNAAQDYLKCFMEQRTFFYSKEGVAQRARYRKMSLIELRLESLPDYSSNALRQADWAARLDSLDWQALHRVQDGDLTALPAELGPLPVLAGALHAPF